VDKVSVGIDGTLGDWGLPGLRLCAAGDSAGIRSVRHQIAQWSGCLRLPAEQVSAICIASYEAMANAVEHGYAQRGGIVEVVANTECNDDDFHIRVSITDHGSWKTPSDNQAGAGLGLTLMHHLADQLAIRSSDTGTHVELVWRAQGPR
jgi:serine/threonine-protein kinase RsbW